MKTIYKTIYNTWQDIKPDLESDISDSIEVANTVITGFLNSIYYNSPTYSKSNYDNAFAKFKKEEARSYLSSTDYISIQWQDETSLEIPHSRTDEEYQEIMQKRQEARDLIRGITN